MRKRDPDFWVVCHVHVPGLVFPPVVSFVVYDAQFAFEYSGGRLIAFGQ